MRVQTAIREKLTREFQPSQLDIVDESHRHAGHAGARPQGESHFNVTMVSTVFEGLGRIDRQRRVYAALAEEMKTDIHALALTLKSPGEA